MFSIKLGLKNLTRQKRRNVLTVLVIAFAFFVFLFLDSLMEGMTEMSFNNIKNYGTGSIQVAHSAYWEDKDKLPLENLIYLNQDVEESIKNMDGVLGVSPELRFKASLNNGIDEIDVQGVGISIEKYIDVFMTQNHVIEGSMFPPGESKAVIGISLAELMDLKVNDYITLLVRTKENTFNTIDLEISGLVHTPNPLTNSGKVFVPLNIAQKALNVKNGVSMMAVKIDREKYIEPTISSINQIFREKNLNIHAHSWKESAKTVMAIRTAEDAETAVILIIILTIGMIGIINNIILSALERTREIGMMKALGMREWEIVSVFMVEATGIGILGGLAGCFLGAVGVWWITEIGYDLSYIGGDMSSYGIPIIDKVYGVWNFSSFVFIFFFGIVVALLSSITPAYWAAHKDPVKAIYHR
ncbi:MAG: FtsX-like permease family protein [Candidatus Caldatribacteriota bacterium]|nr:FtsX-like permease family protein [Candidatus Caldatribacteriota bacterium]